MTRRLSVAIAFALVALIGQGCATKSNRAARPSAVEVHLKGEGRIDIRCDPRVLIRPGWVSCKAFLRGELRGRQWMCPASEWTWGDGSMPKTHVEDPCWDEQPGRVFEARHRYLDPGTHTVRLRLFGVRTDGEEIASGWVDIPIGFPQ